MGDNTGIEWTDATWSPIRGCSRVSAGCTNCYAERVAARFSGPGQPYEGLAQMTAKGPAWTGDVSLVPHMLDQPARWKRPRRIFVNSMSDLFHENVQDAWVESIVQAMADAPQHRFQVLTKRPGRMAAWLHRNQDEGHRNLRHVWWGTSVEDQRVATERLGALAGVPSPNRWVSAEPLIGPLDLARWLWADQPGAWPRLNLIAWVVAGGESGPGARPMQVAWARGLRDQCVASGVPFLFKQWGEWAPADPVAAECGAQGLVRIGKRKAGRLLDGRAWDEYPTGMLV